MADAAEDNRMHEASPRKVAQARSTGQVCVSRDLVSGVVVFAVGAAVVFSGKAALGGLVLFFRDAIQASTGSLLVGGMLVDGLGALASALALPIVAILVAALVVGYVQTHGLFRVRLIPPIPRRLAPRLSRVWGPGTVFRAGKELVKIVALLTAAGLGVCSLASILGRLSGSNASRVFDGMFVMARHLGLVLSLTLLGLGLGDYLWQVFRHRKGLRMTHDEVKREHKEVEGDPIFKAERKRVHVEVSQATALAELVDADLVVIEAGYIAIALRFDPAVFDASVVLCKGKHLLARQIEAVALLAGVPVFESGALAEQLARGEEGGPISEDLYEPIAQLLANRQSGPTGTADRGGPTHAH